MDIAKIRKKLKDEGGKGQSDAGPQKPEATVPQESQPPKEEERPSIDSQPALPQAQEPAAEHEVSDYSRGAIKKEGRAETAKETETVGTDTDIIELLTFSLSAEEFAFRVSDMEEILKLQRITPVPKVPDYILGITSLRGKIIPVVDLKHRLSIKNGAGAAAIREKILILKGAKGPVGALIDKVKGVIRISHSQIAEPPAHLTDVELIFIEGVVLHNNRFVSIIRMEEALGINLKT